MSQPNAWQTANRGGRHSNNNSRTPQNRSNTASPSQQNAPSQPPKQENKPQGNVWTQRAAAQQASSNASSSSNGPRSDAGLQEEPHASVNSFNAGEIKAFLSREQAPAPYKPQDAQGSSRNSGGAWGAKANQPFFVQLAKQVATFEGGG